MLHERDDREYRTGIKRVQQQSAAASPISGYKTAGRGRGASRDIENSIKKSFTPASTIHEGLRRQNNPLR